MPPKFIVFPTDLAQHYNYVVNYNFSYNDVASNAESFLNDDEPGSSGDV